MTELIRSLLAPPTRYAGRITRSNFLACCSLLFSVVACGGGDGGGDPVLPDVDCDDVVPTYSEVEVFHPAANLCTQCHSKDLSGLARNGAPSAVNVDLYESASMFADLIVQWVYQSKMPPAGYTITEEQKQQVYRWGRCGAPE